MCVHDGHVVFRGVAAHCVHTGAPSPRFDCDIFILRAPHKFRTVAWRRSSSTPVRASLWLCARRGVSVCVCMFMISKIIQQRATKNRNAARVRCHLLCISSVVRGRVSECLSVSLCVRCAGVEIVVWVWGLTCESNPNGNRRKKSFA